ncbi:O-antigen ligase family protein [Pseudoalteromonas sp. SMS1]|uniref:O-antigen ligase family protein n=1 Tax=Pseudoalteromonas sp. SMS1 TaxID=2908894 RepID=UPI001F160F19|nr:O-antigen ligase family protein [Pseudoalteromonas sp. SMS1]MCF2857406.1 O-antigen ligase family protein [Pseudoalteromonas sp. SMS1]
MKIINTFAAKELWFVLLLLSGFFKQYLNILNFGSIDFTLAVAGILLLLLFKEYLTSYERKMVSNYSLIGLCSLGSFLFFVFLSLLYTHSEQYFYQKLLSFFVCVYIYFLPQIYKDFNIQSFLKSFINVSLVLTIIFILLYPLVSGSSDFGIIRENYLVVGYLCGLNILLLFALKQGISLKLACFALVLFLTGARGPIIFTVLVSILIWLNMYGFFRIFTPKVLISLFALLFVFIGLIGTVEFMQDMLEGSLNRLFLLFSDDMGSSANVRINHIVDSWMHIKSNPLLGYGFGSYGMVTTGLDIRSYPHNIFIEIWFEIGLLGLLAFTLFCFYHLGLTYRKIGFPAVCILIYILLNALKSSSFAEVKFLFAFLSVFVLLSSSNSEKKFNLS